MFKLFRGDCVKVLVNLPEGSVDAVITDPPYGLEFMGKEWDSFREGGRVKARFGNSTLGEPLEVEGL